MYTICIRLIYDMYTFLTNLKCFNDLRFSFSNKFVVYQFQNCLFFLKTHTATHSLIHTHGRTHTKTPRTYYFPRENV